MDPNVVLFMYIFQPIFERELALLVTLQGITGWKGGRGETSIEKTLLAGVQTVDDLRTLRQGLHKT